MAEIYKFMHIPPYTSPLYDGFQDSNTDAITQSGSSQEAASNKTTARAANSGEAKIADLPTDTVSLNQTDSLGTGTTREAKLSLLKEAIKNNSYHVPTALLADKLIKAGVIKLGSSVSTDQKPN